MALFIHPLIMAVMTLTAWYALALGLVRFAAAHLNRKGLFRWKRHVLAGRIALWGLVAGTAAGLGVTWLAWGAVGTTGAHGLLAAAIAPLSGFGLYSGTILNRKRPARRLALAHGLVSMVLAALLAVQGWLGIRVLVDFVL